MNDPNDRFASLFEGNSSSVLGGMKETAFDPEPLTALEGLGRDPAQGGEKLIQAKQAWAREGRLLSGGTDERRSSRLPPGQRLTKDWPVLDLGTRPLVPLDQWELTVSGAVRNRVKWDWDMFRAQPQKTLTTDIHCVTAWSAFDFTFSGMPIEHLLHVVQPDPAVKFVSIISHDGYRTNLPMTHFNQPENMIAHSWAGEPLSREHGGPARLLVPHLYFWKSAKWIRQLTFLADDAPGFWETRGYHAIGDPWKEQRYE